VTALAVDPLRDRLDVGVALSRQALHACVVAEDAGPIDLACEVIVVLFVSRAQVPDRILRVPAHRRLKELIADRHEIRAAVVSGADDARQLPLVDRGLPALRVDQDCRMKNSRRAGTCGSGVRSP
jgi:hypothetical protein